MTHSLAFPSRNLTVTLTTNRRVPEISVLLMFRVVLLLLQQRPLEYSMLECNKELTHGKRDRAREFYPQAGACFQSSASFSPGKPFNACCSGAEYLWRALLMLRTHFVFLWKIKFLFRFLLPLIALLTAIQERTINNHQLNERCDVVVLHV